jgi:ribokinase
MSRSGTVLVVGSVNADLVVTVDRLPEAGETVTGGRFARHGGGKGANQAVAAARAGAPVRFVGAVGDDDLGATAIEELAAEGVDVERIARLDGEATGVALIFVDREGRNQIAVSSGANARVGEALVAAALDARPLTAGDVVLLGFEVPDEAVLAGARAAAAAGARAVLNPAPARELPGGLPDGVLLVPNGLEAAALTGETDAASAARALAARTGAPVLVTVSADGALLAGPGTDGVVALAAPQVEVVDTTGAGDALCGVLAAGLAAGLDLEPAARQAVEAASASVRHAGARG